MLELSTQRAFVRAGGEDVVPEGVSLAQGAVAMEKPMNQASSARTAPNDPLVTTAKALPA